VEGAGGYAEKSNAIKIDGTRIIKAIATGSKPVHIKRIN
jgi:hypothetical protein